MQRNARIGGVVSASSGSTSFDASAKHRALRKPYNEPIFLVLRHLRVTHRESGTSSGSMSEKIWEPIGLRLENGEQ